MNMAKKITGDIENKKFSLKNFEKGIALSFGIAAFPDDGRDIETLLTAADKKLLKVKRERT